MLVQAHGSAISAGPPSVSEAGGGVVVADGQLADALTPPHWTFAGLDGSFAIFANQRVQRPSASWPCRAVRPLGRG